MLLVQASLPFSLGTAQHMQDLDMYELLWLHIARWQITQRGSSSISHIARSCSLRHGTVGNCSSLTLLQVVPYKTVSAHRNSVFDGKWSHCPEVLQRQPNLEETCLFAVEVSAAGFASY